MQFWLAEGAAICDHHVPNAPDRARLLGEWVQERYHCVEYWVDEAGPVLASHAGPGAVALGWYQEEHGA